MRNPTISRREPPVTPRGEGRGAGVPEGADEQLRQDLAHLADAATTASRATRSRWATRSSCGRFNRDGEADERLKADFQRHLGVDEADKRQQRRGFVALAHPQHGVDAMAAEFTGTTPFPGVVDAGSSPARPR